MADFRQLQPMKPTSGTKFIRRDVERVIDAIIKDKVGDRPYVYADSMQMSKDVAQAIQQQVQELGYTRYKLVVQVFITEACNQGMRITSRCLWDPETDGFGEFTRTTEHMHVTAVVFGLYWE